MLGEPPRGLEPIPSDLRPQSPQPHGGLVTCPRGGGGNQHPISSQALAPHPFWLLPLERKDNDRELGVAGVFVQKQESAGKGWLAAGGPQLAWLGQGLGPGCCL